MRGWTRSTAMAPLVSSSSEFVIRETTAADAALLELRSRWRSLLQSIQTEGVLSNGSEARWNTKIQVFVEPRERGRENVFEDRRRKKK